MIPASQSSSTREPLGGGEPASAAAWYPASSSHAVTARACPIARDSFPAASQANDCTSSCPPDVSISPTGVAMASDRIACTSPAARLCTGVRPACGPGSRASCAGRPVTDGSISRCSRAAATSAAWPNAAVSWSQCAARSIPWNPAVLVNRPSR